MLRWALLLVASVFLASASLVWLRAPTVTTWKLAILVSEFGHALILLPVLLVAVVLVQSGGRPSPVQAVTILVALLTAVSLLRPTVTAWRLAQGMPDRLAKAFGATLPDRKPIEVSALWAVSPEAKVAIETREVRTPGVEEPLKMDFYRAVRPAGEPAPCVVMIHGGGWDSGDRTQLSALNHRLARRGYAVAAISYRLAPAHHWPAQRDDVEAALDALHRDATALGIDPTRIVVMGRSAGGQIATAIAYRSGRSAIRGVVAYYAPHDLHFAWAFTKERDVLDSFKLMRNYLGGGPGEKKQAFDSASGYLAVNPQSPPTLLVHGQIDSLVWHRQSERLAEALEKQGVPHFFLSLPWATHGFDFNPSGPGGQLATYALEAFLASVTR